MVQVIRELGVEYAAANPGSSFEGLQESFINYGAVPNKTPEWITALHEESSVTMAHGYGKAEGKPMCALLHGTIGIQHAAMSIYQAYYDRTPVLLLAGRDEGFIAAHTANDMAGMVRSFTKWDAQPKTLEESLTAIQRAYNEAITPPATRATRPMRKESFIAFLPPEKNLCRTISQSRGTNDQAGRSPKMGIAHGPCHSPVP